MIRWAVGGSGMADHAELPGIVREYLDASLAKDAGRLAACFADDIHFEHHSNTGGTVTARGLAAVRGLVNDSARAIRATRQGVRDVVVAGNRVAVEIDFEGIAAADLPNGLKAGDTLRLRGVSFFTLRDGKIAALRDFC